MVSETIVLFVVLVFVLGGSGFFFYGRHKTRWNERNLTPEPHSAPGSDLPVMETEAKLTPRAEARSANKLPRAEQLNKFEQHLEAHDSGNQPA